MILGNLSPARRGSLSQKVSHNIVRFSVLNRKLTDDCIDKGCSQFIRGIMDTISSAPTFFMIDLCINIKMNTRLTAASQNRVAAFLAFDGTKTLDA